jgi:chorismate synthase
MSSFGTLFRVSTFGESHGIGVGCIVDGVPPGMELTEKDVQPQLTRRRPGQSSITTPRQEDDRVEILSGCEDGKTLGTPIAMMVRNKDQRKFDYANTKDAPRPGHADYTYQVKYGVKAKSGGGRASARETISRVAAGAVAEKWLGQEHGVQIVCWVSSVMDIDIPPAIAEAMEQNPPSRQDIDTIGTLAEDEKNDCFIDITGQKYRRSDGEPIKKDAEPQEDAALSWEKAKSATEAGAKWLETASKDYKLLHTRCPHTATAARMAARIQWLRDQEDSTGGIATCVISNVPVGLGEPCFDKLEAELAKAMMSLPATKAFEIGDGYKSCRARGSENNDLFKPGSNGLLRCQTNHAGGTLGGISSGENIVMKVGIKPASSISRTQETVTFDGEAHTLTVKGRHDPCVLPRAPPLLEGMAAITILDACLRQRARAGAPLQTLAEAGHKRKHEEMTQ